MIEMAQAAVVGLISGMFSAGAIWGVLKTELRYLRRDVDELRRGVKCA